jgi:hypothetical protein
VGSGVARRCVRLVLLSVVLAALAALVVVSSGAAVDAPSAPGRIASMMRGDVGAAVREAVPAPDGKTSNGGFADLAGGDAANVAARAFPDVFGKARSLPDCSASLGANGFDAGLLEANNPDLSARSLYSTFKRYTTGTP